MMRNRIIALLIFFFAGGIISTFWFGHYFLLYGVSQDRLSVAPLEKQELPLGTPVTFHLSGSGFDNQTHVSLFADVRTSEAVVGTFPLNGYFVAALKNENYLYLAANGGGIQVLDVSVADKPRLLKEYLADRSVVDIHRHDNTLYLSCGKKGVSIMTILPGGMLEHVRDIVPDLTVSKTFFHKGFLYVSAGPAGLIVVDPSASDHAPPYCQIITHFSSDFAIFKHYLYAPNKRGNIEIFNIGQPSHRNLVHSFKTIGNVRDLIIRHKKLYLATESGVFQYSLENPVQPLQAQQWEDFGSARKLFAGEKYIYVADSFSGFRMIDTASGRASEFINLQVSPHTIVEVDNDLYVAGFNRGVLILDRSILPGRSSVKSLNTGGSAYDLLALNHWLYVADVQRGLLLKSLDDTDPFKVVTKQRCDSLSKWENYLFVSHRHQGIEVFDISDPEDPKSIALYRQLQGLRFVVLDHYLVATQGHLGVDLIDIQDIKHPHVADHLDDLFPLGLAVQNDYLYIASKNRGLLIFQLLDGGKLKQLGQIETPFPMNHFDMSLSVQVVNDTAYIANGRSGLLIIDVADPSHPTILSSTAIPGTCKDLEIVGNLAYVVSHKSGISVVDIKNARKPIILNTFSAQGLSRGIQVVDGKIYVAHRDMGVTTIPTPVVRRNITVSSSSMGNVTLPSPTTPGHYNLQISNGNGHVVLEKAVSYFNPPSFDRRK